MAIHMYMYNVHVHCTVYIVQYEMIVLCRRQVQRQMSAFYCDDMCNALNLANEMNGAGVPNSISPQAIELKWLAAGPTASK